MRNVTIDTLRHGEPEGGLRIRGWRDDPLSETGWSQMWAAVEGNRPWHAIVTSPLSRCAGFARKLAAEQGVPLYEEPRLREIGFGEWEGMDPAVLYREQPEAVSNFWADPTTHPPPGGESFEAFQQRVTAAFASLHQERQEEHLLVVAHGGVIRMLISHILGMPPANMFRMEVPYAAASRIRVEDGMARLSFHGGRF